MSNDVRSTQQSAVGLGRIWNEKNEPHYLHQA